ncbi:MAG: ribonuclease Y [Planctomycetes bacterium]|nr:ribonuclease Y [Planctomycetota bacterium]
MEYIIGGVAGLVLGFIICQVLAAKIRKQLAESTSNFDSKLQAEQLRVSNELEEKAKDSLAKKRSSLEKELSDEQERVDKQNDKLKDLEKTLNKRESSFGKRENALDNKFDKIDKKEARLQSKEDLFDNKLEALDQRDKDLDAQEEGFAEKLSQVSQLSIEEAKSQLFERLDRDLLEEKGKLIKARTQAAEAEAKEKANELVGRAIQRYAAEHTADTTTAKIKLANEELKGRIIGKEGRNIRSFQEISGVDLIIDDTPNEITISCFDGVRREIARRALLQLMEDGRIQPARIEEVFQLKQQEMDREVLKLGEDAAYACDVSGLHPQILKLLGKLQFRTSYGQNVLKHTQEVAYLTGALAADMGLDPKLGKRCGLLHDIGKAIDHEQEGSHPELGFEALNRYGENEIVANAALAHHEGHDVLTLYTTLTAAADAISAARPGARRENVERYIKRLIQLEDIACSFKGVMKSYAIQAGRELRVIVNASILEDNALSSIARDIARRIEDEVAYPGEVKVTLIRETRTAAVAR